MEAKFRLIGMKIWWSLSELFHGYRKKMALETADGFEERFFY